MGGYCVTFVTISDNREQLAILSRLLIALIPGCTIHQNSNPMRAIRCLSHQKVDAVFADADTCANAMEILRKQKMQTQLCLLCRQGADIPEEVPYSLGVLSYPLTEQKMQSVLRSENGSDKV